MNWRYFSPNYEFYLPSTRGIIESWQRRKNITGGIFSVVSLNQYMEVISGSNFDVFIKTKVWAVFIFLPVFFPFRVFFSGSVKKVYCFCAPQKIRNFFLSVALSICVLSVMPCTGKFSYNWYRISNFPLSWALSLSEIIYSQVFFSYVCGLASLWPQLLLVSSVSGAREREFLRRWVRGVLRSVSGNVNHNTTQHCTHTIFLLEDQKTKN